MSSSIVNVYTAAKFQVHHHYGFRAGIGVYWEPNHPLNVSEPIICETTKSRAELLAVVKAVTQAKDGGVPSIKICTESRYFMFVIGKMSLWKANGWRLSDGNEIVNCDSLQLLDELKDDVKCCWACTFRTGNPHIAAATQLAIESLSSVVVRR